jgi:very-short-patch-repair endonuclease
MELPNLNQPADDQTVRQDLANLLRFTEGLLATGEKTVFNISEYPVRLTEPDFLWSDGSLLPGVAFAPSDDVWLSFARLKETRPPKPPADLDPWLRPEPRPNPLVSPVLVAQRVIKVGADELSRLVDRGLADQQSITLAEEGQGAEAWEVPMRPQDLTSIMDAFHDYVDGPWKAWAAEEAPRRKAIELYGGLFKAHSQAAAGGVETVVGIGLARWVVGTQSLHVPIIEQRAELELDTATGSLSIVPRSAAAVPALKPFMEMGLRGAAELQRDLTELLDAIYRDPVRPFGPFQRSSFIGALERCASTLDSRGAVLDLADTLEPLTDALRISPSFCVIVRPRRVDFLRADIQRLISRVTDAATILPQTALRFVIPPPDIPSQGAGPIDWGKLGSLGTGAGTSGSTRSSGSSEVTEKRQEWLFFPLPANDEQEEIARRLEDPEVHGVVVQGPPGTGKTHTIANIIGHAMARGRRVLVAAHTAEALSAIREKLPPAIRDLVIAITHSDRDGLRQMEQAVSLLADRALSLNVADVKREIEDLARILRGADIEIEDIDRHLAEIARANMTEVDWRGGSALPAAIGTWAASQGNRHDWLVDQLDMVSANHPRFSSADIAEARRLRVALGADIIYKAGALPAGSNDLPAVKAVLDAHHAIRDAVARQELERDGGLIRPDLTDCGPGDLAKTLAWLDRLAAWRTCAAGYAGLMEAWERVFAGRTESTTEYAMLEEAATLAATGERLNLLALDLEELDDPHALTQPLGNLASGRKPFGIIGGFGKNPARTAIDAAKVAAERPVVAADWQKLADLHAWRIDVRRFVARWNAFAAQRGFARLPNERDRARTELIELGRLAREFLALASGAHRYVELTAALLPYGIDVPQSVKRAEVELAIASLRAAVAESGLLEADRLRKQLHVAAVSWGGPLGQSLQQVAVGLGSAELADSEAASLWRTVLNEAARVASLRADLSALDAVSSAVAASGAPIWARAIRNDPSERIQVALSDEWRDAWDYARARGFLARVADRSRIETLTRRRAELVEQRERNFRREIELLTYCGLRSRLTDRVQGALRQFMAALSKMPKTPGALTAPHWRRVMRESMDVAGPAIPCWIMPEWRVAEYLPSELGQFDLVIIDEASQSNITALASVLRGRKLLVVGDDKQVSPMSIGIQNAVINRLRDVFVKGQPLADHFDPATSLYELAGMMYPGKVTVLREHFRCVEPIIRFSSRYYGNNIVPLRLPKPSERMDPPLVDLLVEDGTRNGDINRREAAVIVDEIASFVADERLHRHGKRTVGVISLHSDKQAKLIYDGLIERIGPERMSDHSMMCGDAATFQGQERDIVFLSMVHDERTATKQSSKLYEQRYNVALSRARDRMVLVRSVMSSMLKEGDVKLEVLRHFEDPAAGGRIGQSRNVLEVCESKFEIEVGRRLLDEGFRIRAQVPAGGYRIDFVVEGDNDARLAVELDGDSFHGPDRWAQDVKRQKALERVGWIFWRCWASEWAANQEVVFKDLQDTLQRLGVEPSGSNSPSDQNAVEFRRVSGRSKARVTKNTMIDDSEKTDAFIKPTLVPASAAARQVARMGDRITVRYADGRAGVLTVRLVSEGLANGRDCVSVRSPLGMAVIGLGIEDEADVQIDGRVRTVVLEQIESSPGGLPGNGEAQSLVER